MSAETLGKAFRQEVREEWLDEKTLHFLRSLDPFSLPPPTGIRPLDDLLQIFQAAPTQPQQHSPKYSTPPVLELSSAVPCSGKTQLLYKILILALLPQSHASIPLGGKSSAVVLFDLSSKVSILRLRNVMTAHISTCAIAFQSAPLQMRDIQNLVQASLLHLHIFRPQSPSSFSATLASLRNYFFSKPLQHISALRPISSIILSDLSAFNLHGFLQPTSNTLSSESNITATRKSPPIDISSKQRDLISVLRSLQISFSCPIIATTSSFFFPMTLQFTNNRTLRPAMPPIWNAFVTVQLVVERVSVTKFPPTTSTREGAALRQGIVEKTVRRGWINYWGVDAWRDEVKEGVRKWETNFSGGIDIWIGEDVDVGDSTSVVVGDREKEVFLALNA
ncbi:hypothetical protein MMC31_001843 [Peltigera leucophlebia]|nr:hypothetical protein [Peltigera leucophlebia]